MDLGPRLLCWAIALLIAAAPLPFGSVGVIPAASLQIAVLTLAALWVAMRWRAGLSPLPWKDPLLLSGAALLGYALIQMAPLPLGLAQVLSPEGSAMHTTYGPDPGGWIPLSLSPYATWLACMRILCLTLLAVMVRRNASAKQGRTVVAAGLLAGGLFQAAYGLFEFISGRQHIFDYEKRYFTDVATGTFISRNNYAGYLEMAIPMALALALLCLGRSRRSGVTAVSPRQTPSSLKHRLSAATGKESFYALLLLLGAFLMLTALLMSRSRMGIVSIAIALTVGGMAVGLSGGSRRFAVASALVAGLVLIFASQIDILPVVDRFFALRLEMGGGFGRYTVWSDAMSMLAAYPVFGSGLGTWELAFSPFRTDAIQVRVDFAHNDYLEFFAEAGVIGLVILGGGLWLVLRRHATAVSFGGSGEEIALAAGVGSLAMALHSLTDFHMSIPADALALAALCGLFLRLGGQEEDRVLPVPARVSSVVVCCALLAGLAAAAALPAIAQARSDRPGPAAAIPTDESHDLDAGPLVPSAAAPDDDLCPACRFEPLNPKRYIDAGARARLRLLKDTEVIVRAQAMGIFPDPKTRLYLARRIDAALALVHRGLELAPVSARGHLEAGLLHFGRYALTGLPPQASEDFDLARDQFEMAMSLQPWRAATHRKVARVLSPLWSECDEEQRRSIARAVLRARELDPRAADIKETIGRLGL